MNRVNHQVIFLRRPDGVPTQDIFSFTESPLPQPDHNEYVVRNHFVAMDPALVSRMRDEDNYTEAAVPGENDGKQLVRLVNEEAGE